MLPATATCTFSTPKTGAPTLKRFFRVCTPQCASRNYGVHFLRISTCISAPRMVCIARFDFEICFLPLFRHLNDQKFSKPEVFCAFLTSKCALRHSRVQVLISHLTRWLRTRRFSEPTFRASRATKHWKDTLLRDFSTFSHTLIFFSSPTLPTSSASSAQIVGSLTSKLPSSMYVYSMYHI